MIEAGDFNFDCGTVEVDEALFKHFYDDERRVLVQHQWVIGLFHRESGLVWLERSPNRSSASIIPIIRRHVANDSIICTDEFRSYLPLADERYFHFTCNHRHGDYAHEERHSQVDKNFTVSFNSMESLWSRLRPRLNNPAYHSMEMLDRALARLMFEQTSVSLFDLYKI